MRCATLALALLASSVAQAQRDPCASVDCSGVGTCFDERGSAHCLCDAGYSEIGLGCVESPRGEEVLRFRHVPAVGERAAAIATSQIGRRLPQIGDEDDSLVGYLSRREWWCGDFVAWVYNAAGVPFSGGSAGGWLVTNNRAITAWFDQRGHWYERTDESFTPRPGDYMRLPTPRGGHAAIVQQVIGSTIYAVEGNVNGRVELTPYYHYRRNPQIEGFGRLELDNAPPVLAAGEPLTVVLGRGGELSAEITDDGPDSALTITWIGADTVHFDDATARDTRVRFDTPGSYLLRLRVDDGEHVVTDDVQVDVVTNEPPRVSAMMDPDSRELHAEVWDDGRSGPLERWWSVVEGDAEIEDPGALRTPVHLGGPGRYVFRIVVTDGEHETVADVEVEVAATFGACSAAPGSPAAPPLSLLVALGLTRIGRPRRRRRRFRRRSGTPGRAAARSGP